MKERMRRRITFQGMVVKAEIELIQAVSRQLSVISGLKIEDRESRIGDKSLWSPPFIFTLILNLVVADR